MKRHDLALLLPRRRVCNKALEATGGDTIMMMATLHFRFIFFLAALLLFSDAANAADDTFACLSRSGPRITVSQDFGYNQYKNRRFADGTVFDARQGRWKHEQVQETLNLYPINVGGGDNGCWAGGIVEGTSDLNARWSELYRGGDGDPGSANSASIVWVDARDMTVDGIRVHNTWDAVRSASNAPNFVIKNVWASRTRDDCIENDNGNSGVITDSLFDGCYVGISATAANAGTMRIEHTLLRLQPFPGAHNEGVSLQPGHKGFFKIRQGNGLELHNNVFMAEQLGNFSESNQSWGLGIGDDLADLKSCSGNVMVWLGDGRFPGDWQLDKFPDCIHVISGDEGRQFWNAAKQNWINCHPKVRRVPGDPPSEPLQCDPSAYGGGGTGVASDFCHLFTSSDPVPIGFGAAYNVFSPARDVILKATCGPSSNATLTVGNGDNALCIYKTGYEWSGHAWEPFEFGGSTLDGDCYVGSATANIVRSQAELAETNFVLFYTCFEDGNRPKCGCRDVACTTSYWQLQAFRR